MTENEFFSKMEYRVCGELAGMRDKSFRGFWCDGFLLERDFSIVGNQSEISGRVWIGNGGRHQACWTFTLLLGFHAPNRESINWDWAMPDDELTGWLSMDFEKKQMKIDLVAAQPDRSPTPE